MLKLLSTEERGGLVRPQRPQDIIERPALAERIDNGLAHSVCALVAPSGSGKSTVLRQYYSGHKRQRHIAWLPLSDKDNNATRFFLRLTQAVTGQIPEFQGYILSQSALSDHENNRVLLDVFVSEINRQNQELIIIVDNLDCLSGSTWLSNLGQLINQCPKIHWLLACQEQDLLAQLALTDTNQITTLTVADLNFSLVETSKLLSNSSLQINEDDLGRTVFEQTRGHVATIKVIQLLKTLTDSTCWQSQTDCQQLIQNLISELPVDVRQTLINTAFLAEFNEELCQFVLNQPSCSAQIQYLEDTHFLLERSDEEYLSFQHHPMVRQILQHYFHQQDRSTNDQLISRACTWLTEHNHREAALAVAMQHSQSSFFQELFDQSFTYWLKAGDIESMAFVIQNSPYQILLTSAKVQLAWLWVLILSGQVNQAEQILKSSAFNQPDDRAPAEPSSLDINYLVIRALVDLLKDRLSESRLHHLKAIYNHTSANRHLRISIDNLLAYQATNQLQFSSALHYALRAQVLAEQSNNAFGQAIAIYIQVRLYYLKNDLPSAMTKCEQYLRRQGLRHGLGGRSLMEAAQAYLLYMGDQPKRAQGINHRVINRCRIGLSNDVQISLFVPTLRQRARQGDYKIVDALLDYLTGISADSGSSTFNAQITFERYYLACLSQNNQRLKELEEQHQLLDRVSHYIDSSTDIGWETREKIVLSTIFYLACQQRLNDGKYLCKQLLYLNIELGYPIRHPSISMVSAWLDYRLGNGVQAYKTLNNALLQADATGVTNGLFDDIPGVEPFINQAIASGNIERPQHLQKLSGLGFIDRTNSVAQVPIQ